MFRISVRVCICILLASCALPLNAQQPVAASANLAAQPLILANRASGVATTTTLYAFTGGTDGNEPSGVTFDNAGNIYGTASGGTLGYGFVFELTPNSNGTWTKSVLYQFMGGHDRAYPSSSLIFDATGNLYGTTDGGGDPDHCVVGSVDGCGVVFELTPNSNGTWNESPLYQFTGGSDGAFPASPLIFDGAGNLYGTTFGGGNIYGVAFKLSPSNNGWTESVLYTFGSKHTPPSSLVLDPAGNLYGTSAGVYTNGQVFKLTPTTSGEWTYAILHAFTGGTDGAHPEGGLIIDATGNLYGTTSSGGAFGFGNVFKLTFNPKGYWSEHILHQFPGGSLGAQPVAGLTRDAAGNLFGTTYYGGHLSRCNNGCGVAFELRPTAQGWKATLRSLFGDHPGAHPAAALILDKSGNLYGTTQGDGTATFGSVFEITP